MGYISKFKFILYAMHTTLLSEIYFSSVCWVLMQALENVVKKTVTKERGSLPPFPSVLSPPPFLFSSSFPVPLHSLKFPPLNVSFSFSTFPLPSLDNHFFKGQAKGPVWFQKFASLFPNYLVGDLRGFPDGQCFTIHSLGTTLSLLS